MYEGKYASRDEKNPEIVLCEADIPHETHPAAIFTMSEARLADKATGTFEKGFDEAVVSLPSPCGDGCSRGMQNREEISRLDSHVKAAFAP